MFENSSPENIAVAATSAGGILASFLLVFRKIQRTWAADGTKLQQSAVETALFKTFHDEIQRLATLNTALSEQVVQMQEQAIELKDQIGELRAEVRSLRAKVARP